MYQVEKKILIILLTVSLTTCQFRISYYQEKPGSCPPALPVQICSQACFVDEHCQGIGKCCPTSCGGAVCSKPAVVKRANAEKAGSCPEIPQGRWICAASCTVDSDCKGTLKCCKTLCGVLACQLPEVTPKSKEARIKETSDGPLRIHLNTRFKQSHSSNNIEKNGININSSSNNKINQSSPFSFHKGIIVLHSHNNKNYNGNQ